MSEKVITFEVTPYRFAIKASQVLKLQFGVKVASNPSLCGHSIGEYKTDSGLLKCIELYDTFEMGSRLQLIVLRQGDRQTSIAVKVVNKLQDMQPLQDTPSFAAGLRTSITQQCFIIGGNIYHLIDSDTLLAHFTFDVKSALDEKELRTRKSLNLPTKGDAWLVYYLAMAKGQKTTGQLLLNNGTEEALISFMHGRPIYSKYGTTEGEAALMQIAEHSWLSHSWGNADASTAANITNESDILIERIKCICAH